jgi:hypothetical protein
MGLHMVQINHVLYKAKWRSFDLFNMLDEDDMTLVVNKMKVCLPA